VTSWSWGTVTGLSPVRVLLDGDSVALPFKPVLLVSETALAVGTRVWCQTENHRLIVVGLPGGPAQIGAASASVVLGAQASGFYWSEVSLISGSLVAGRNYLAHCFNGDWAASAAQIESVTAPATAKAWNLIDVGYNLISSTPGPWRLSCILHPM